MRAVPMMRVEVAGAVVSRPGQLEVLLYDRTGRPTISRIRPQLLPGEVLVERAGMIPQIVSVFVPTAVKYEEWLKPAPEHEGERIVWRDGSVHGAPEDDSEFVTVLRRAPIITKDTA
jgi:hypothetical protein